MLSTSLAALVMSGVVATVPTGSPAWHTDYAAALARAAESNKPIAVFIAHGGTGYARVVAEGNLPADDARQLGQSYVCLYVDTATEKGKKLAGAFEMNEGLVISDRTGEKQALRHEGKVSREELHKYLTRYADPNRAVVTTETPAAFVAAAPAVITTPQPAPVIPAFYPAARPAAACSS